MSTCVICNAEVDDAFACMGCTMKVQGMISRAGITYDSEAGSHILCLLDELDLALSRQARTVTNVGGRSAETPLPFDGRASKAQTNLAHVLTRWARVYGLVGGSGAPRNGARWLVRHSSLLMAKPDIRWLHVELTAAINAAVSVIDSPPERMYIGVCSAPRTDLTYCHTELYALDGSLTVQCPVCRTVHHVDDRRKVMMHAVENVYATATDIAHAVHLFGEPIKASLIYKWRERGKLTAQGEDQSGHPLYRVGDVLELARDSGLHSRALSDSM